MDSPGQLLGNVQLALDEGPVDDQFRGFVWNLRCSPSHDLLLHRLEVSLDPIDSDREHIDEAEVFRVFRQYGSEHAWLCAVAFTDRRVPAKQLSGPAA